MSRLRVGVVAEGPTDHVVISMLLKEHFSAARSRLELEFVELQPNMDRTSCGYNGGWQLVYKWCVNNPPSVRELQNFSASLFADEMNDKICDVILVHLDVDIYSELASTTQTSPVPSRHSPVQERADFVSECILDWLWPSGTIPDRRHIAAPAAQSVEAWLVAGLCDDPNPEEIEGILRRLVELDHEIRGQPTPADAKQIKKRPERYAKVAAKAALKVNEIVERCTLFNSLTQAIADFANDKPGANAS